MRLLRVSPFQPDELVGHHEQLLPAGIKHTSVRPSGAPLPALLLRQEETTYVSGTISSSGLIHSPHNASVSGGLPPVMSASVPS